MGLSMGQKLIKSGTTWGPDFVEHISPKPLDGFSPTYTVRSSMEASNCVIVCSCAASWAYWTDFCTYNIYRPYGDIQH